MGGEKHVNGATTTDTKTRARAAAGGAGRFYLVSSGILPKCGRLGYRLLPCPTCGAAFPSGPALRFVWIAALLQDRPCRFERACRGTCPFSAAEIERRVAAGAPYRAGMVWAPLAKYPTGAAFERAIRDAPIAWPIRKLAPALVVGSTPILIAHARAILDADGSTSPSLVAAFIPSSIVYVPGPKDRAPYLRRLSRLGVEIDDAPPIGAP